jgi:hypothetical protein
MGEALSKHMKAKARKEEKDRDDDLTPKEKKSLQTLRQEAKDRGVTLASGGKGGLSPNLVLDILRRDKYHCKVGREGCTQDQNLTMHHKAGIVESRWLSKKGHENTPNNLVTICENCHDLLHEEARAEGIDSSQVLPEGDKGTKRDHGDLPVAHPDH